MSLDELTSAVADGSLDPMRFTRELWRLSNGHQRQGRVIHEGQADLYRSRSFETATRPLHGGDLTYPPLNKVRVGRANTDTEQVFYCSAGMPTTLAESRVRAGQYLVSSRWVSTRQLTLQSVGFESESVDLEKLYHDIFTSSDESTYKYSSLVASHLMNGPQISGLLYPSTINQDQAQNLALKKAFVDSSLNLRYAALYFVKSISSDSLYEVEEIDFARPDEKNKLVWAGRKRQWTLTKQGEELAFVANGWEWNAYRSDGTYVEPE